MLSYAVTFFIVALIAALFGFWGVAGLAVEIAKILCFLFVVLLALSLVVGRRPGIKKGGRQRARPRGNFRTASKVSLTPGRGLSG